MKTNKQKVIIFCGCLLLIFVALVLGISSKVSNNRRTAKKISQLPTFTYLAPDSSKQNSIEFKNANTIIIVFSTDCQFCQEEAKAFTAQKDIFFKKNVLWLTCDNLADIKAFDSNYKLSASNFKVGKISYEQRMELFDARHIPSILTYNEQGAMLKRYVGETKPETVAKVLH